MSNFYDAERVIDFLIKNKLITNNNWKKHNNPKYVVSFNREEGLNGIISFEITVKNEKLLIREHNLILCLSRLNFSEKEINELIKNFLFNI